MAYDLAPRAICHGIKQRVRLGEKASVLLWKGLRNYLKTALKRSAGLTDSSPVFSNGAGRPKMRKQRKKGKKKPEELAIIWESPKDL
jgi:hypothetical protein